MKEGIDKNITKWKRKKRHKERKMEKIKIVFSPRLFLAKFAEKYQSSLSVLKYRWLKVALKLQHKFLSNIFGQKKKRCSLSDPRLKENN